MLPETTFKKGLAILFLLLFCSCTISKRANAQYFDLNSNRKRVNIPFRSIRGLVVIALKINDKGPFNFVLDTGVGLMLITDPTLVDSLQIPNRRTLKLFGLGNGEDVEAYATSPLRLQIPGLTSYDVAAAILKKDRFGLSNYAGMPIHGLLGYEFFSNLAVKLDFADSTITVCRPKDLKILRKGSKIPITVEEHKPYMKALIRMSDGSEKQNKLIIDLGAGHALLLENLIQNHGLPSKFITANLGFGFNGPISGFLSRVNHIELGNYRIKNVITSFPENDTLIKHTEAVKRDGNLGYGLLKKFIVVLDYQDSLMYLKPGPKYTEPFEHDMSGLEYYATGEKFDHIIISRVEPGSPADAVGLEPEDEITAINFKAVAKMSLEDIDTLFKSANERSLLLEIYHDKKFDHVIISLKRRI